MAPPQKMQPRSSWSPINLDSIRTIRTSLVSTYSKETSPTQLTQVLASIRSLSNSVFVSASQPKALLSLPPIGIACKPGLRSTWPRLHHSLHCRTNASVVPQHQDLRLLLAFLIKTRNLPRTHLKTGKTRQKWVLKLLAFQELRRLNFGAKSWTPIFKEIGPPIIAQTMSYSPPPWVEKILMYLDGLQVTQPQPTAAHLSLQKLANHNRHELLPSRPQQLL